MSYKTDLKIKLFLWYWAIR
jgi:hypothetical protein